MNGCKKGQAAAEFLAVFGFLLLVFVVVQIVLLDSRNSAEEERQAIFAEKFVRGVASKINLVSESPGFETRFEVTRGLGEQALAYTLTLSNSSASVSYNYGGALKSAAAPVRASRLNNGSGAQAFNLSTIGAYRVNNTRGVVYVVPA